MTRSQILKEIAAETAEIKAVEGGVSGFRTLSCYHCRLPFDVPISRGLYPNYCRRKECIAERARAERERDAQRHQEAEMARRNREGIRAVMAPLYREENARLCVHELGDVVNILASYEPTQDNPRTELKRFVVAAARAKGTTSWRRALIELAACAIYLASQFGPGANQRSAGRLR